MLANFCLTLVAVYFIARAHNWFKSKRYHATWKDAPVKRFRISTLSMEFGSRAYLTDSMGIIHRSWFEWDSMSRKNTPFI